MSKIRPNKELGQHWLNDAKILEDIVACAEISEEDVVLEIGPGLGTLTQVLARRAGRVIAVEFDKILAEKLKQSFAGSKKVEVVHSDILKFNLSKLPTSYKVVANVPYYITAKIIQLLMTAKSSPDITVLLVQKEVAERLAAQPGELSVLGVSAQYYAEVSLGEVVLAEYFIPPPKVDSQVVILKRRQDKIIPATDDKAFFRAVKAGFSAEAEEAALQLECRPRN